MKRYTQCLTAVALTAAMATAAHAAQIIPIYGDSQGEGFFSTDPVPPDAQECDGKPCDNLGELRRWAFERAVEFWEVRLESTVPIYVKAEMNPLACDGSGGVISETHPSSVFFFGSDGNPQTKVHVWYPASLVDRLTDTNVAGATPDIEIIMNSELGTSNCMPDTEWYYGFGNEPAGTVSFRDTVIHDMVHGLGMVTTVTLSNGDLFFGKIDVYAYYLHDHSLGLTWRPGDMTASQRAASATDTNDLHWIGNHVNSNVGVTLADGYSGGHVEMYAPSTLDIGASVIHVDEDVQNNNGFFDIMTPVAQENSKLVVTDDLLQDIGWNDVPSDFTSCLNVSDYVAVTDTGLTGPQTHKACIRVVYNGAVVESGQINAVAGHYVVLENGFTVKKGATFSVDTGFPLGQ